MELLYQHPLLDGIDAAVYIASCMGYAYTRLSCYVGYITQAIVNNLAPLLFIIFQTRYEISVEMLGRLVLLNFITQLVTDILAIRYVGRSYRGPLVAAHLLAGAGLILLGIAPEIAPTPYMGLCIAVIVYAIGGGLLEVLVSPVIESLPTPQHLKAAAMSLLHSFYCWGQVLVVIGTTLLLKWIGQDAWRYLPAIWAIVPLANMVLLLRTPLPETIKEEHRMPLRELLANRIFLAALLLMFCAGASELTMSQWSSLFAEKGIGVSKVVGDLAGPCLFAGLMGTGRVLYGILGHRIPLLPALIFSGSFASLCYLVAVFSSSPIFALVGCASCGLAVSLLWPGTFSDTAARFPTGGVAMFGTLAVFGDGGAAIGPWMAGAFADASLKGDGMIARIAQMLPDDGGSGLRIGLLAGMIFPLLIVSTALWLRGATRKAAEQQK